MCWVRRLSGSLWVYACVVAVLEEIAAFALWRGTADCCEVRSQFRSCVALCMSHWIWWHWVKGETARPSHLTASLSCWWWVEDESKSKNKKKEKVQQHGSSVHWDKPEAMTRTCCKVTYTAFTRTKSKSLFFKNLHVNQISFSIFQVISRVCDLLITDKFKCLIYLKHTQFVKLSWDLVLKVISLLSLV